MAISLDSFFNATVPLWLEVSLALAAALVLALAKMFYLPKSSKKQKKNKEVVDTTASRASFALSQEIEAEVKAGNCRAALAAWRASKGRCAVLVECLPHLVRAFLDADPNALTAEMLEHMGAHASTLATPKAAAAVLDAVARSGGVQLLEDLATALQQRLRIQRGTAMYEALLNGFASAGCKHKVSELVAQMRARKQKVTARGFSLIIKGFLRSGLIDEALAQLGEMHVQGFHVPSFAVTELFRAAREAGRCSEVFDKVINQVKLNIDAVTTLLEDCLARQDLTLAARVRALASETGVSLPPAASEAVLRLYASAGDIRAIDLLDEMQRSGSLRFTEGFCVGILTRCAESKFLRLAEEVVRRARSQHSKMTVTSYSALMKVYSYTGMYSKACDIYDELCRDGLQPDSIMYGCVLRFANECGRSDLVQELSGKVDACDVHHCMSLMRAAGSEGNLHVAFEHFEKLKAAFFGKPDVTSYNCLVDVCVNAGDMQRARTLLDDMRAINHIDKITYNTMMKGYCAQGDAKRAKALLTEMEALGFAPNDITFNSLINMSGSSGNIHEAWGFIKDMQRRGIRLDKYTICTMLKSLRRLGGSRRETARVLELLDTLDLNICSDEVLLNIVLDTCIRQSEQQRLVTILKSYEKSNLWPAPHTYGTLIRAYSALKRVGRCRDIWAEMMETRHMELNGIVLGCMLDALVCSGCMEEARSLFDKFKGKANGNSVLYSTMMKGFANNHLPEQAMELFHEMRAVGIRTTTTTYNTVADAQARVGNTNAVQMLVDLMKEDRCAPDHVTYSILVKAHCYAGNLEQAVQVFKSMQSPEVDISLRSGAGARDGSVTIAFNTLIDGCIKHNKMGLADQLLSQMEEFGVQPTNFTLCIFLKMCGRRRQLERALRAVETWPSRYNITTNSAVKTCLMSTCLKGDSLENAFKVFEDVKACGHADSKIYSVLLSGCVRQGALEKATRLAEEAYGLEDNDGFRPGLEMQALEQLCNALVQKGSGDACRRLLRSVQAAGVAVSGRLAAIVREDSSKNSNS
mmetsp:Transcript_16123/g.29030  ORF Transcript_16123/g.29030 Transcript_16123/m.29030 type:complete len:1035 (+) Transcript_16123:85-3189(+)